MSAQNTNTQTMLRVITLAVGLIYAICATTWPNKAFSESFNFQFLCGGYNVQQ